MTGKAMASARASLILDQHGVVSQQSQNDRLVMQSPLHLTAEECQGSGDNFESVYAVGQRPQLYNQIGLR